MEADGGLGERGGERRRENEKQHCPFSLFTLCPPLLLHTALQCFSIPSHHVSGRKKTSLFLSVELSSLKVLFVEIRTDHWNSILHFLHSRHRQTNKHSCRFDKNKKGRQWASFNNFFDYLPTIGFVKNKRIPPQKTKNKKHQIHKIWADQWFVCTRENLGEKKKEEEKKGC